MSSHSLAAGAARRSAAATWFRLLDPVFGYFLWAAHFLVIYGAAAVACVLGLGRAGEGTQAVFLTVLAALTAAAVAVLVVHGLGRYRQQRDVADQQVRMTVTIGGDAVAAVAVAWQFFPILLTPVCA